jgi:hypothetical protein
MQEVLIHQNEGIHTAATMLNEGLRWRIGEID